MIDAIGNEVIPLEEQGEEGFEVAEFLRGIANKKKPFSVKSISVSKNGDVYLKTDTITKEVKVGRNDTCPCGSGKKYKKCCGR